MFHAPGISASEQAVVNFFNTPVHSSPGPVSLRIKLVIFVELDIRYGSGYWLSNLKSNVGCDIDFESGDVMARLEQIIDQARNLSYAEKQKLRADLDAELEQQPKSLHETGGAHAEDNSIRERRLDWLKTHCEEYAGQYVALVGDTLVGHGRTMREANEQARKNGANDPFLVHLTSESEVLFAGW